VQSKDGVFIVRVGEILRGDFKHAARAQLLNAMIRYDLLGFLSIFASVCFVFFDLFKAGFMIVAMIHGDGYCL
jgi:hypothetical protein